MFSNCENIKSNVFNGGLICESYIINFDWILHEYTLKLPFALKTKNTHKCISYKSDSFIITSIEKGETSHIFHSYRKKKDFWSEKHLLLVLTKTMGRQK